MNKKIAYFLENLNIHKLQDKLIEWFTHEKRELPWRKTQDPYKVWVSEVMLQQTRVDTVIPYYEKFMDKYPTIKKLAKADEQELLKVWEGLGYYSRARNLQAAVREVESRYGGVVPPTKKEFIQLKGVGPYTAGAVLSIAYNLPEPAVDGNVMRVLSRIFCIEDDIGKAKTRKIFEELVSEIISHEDPSSFNQGLMELGALICKPGTPDCEKCPVKEFCGAYKTGRQTEFPVKKKQIKVKTVDLTAAILLDEENRIIIRQRASEGLLANLWEFPTEEIGDIVFENMLTAFEKEIFEKHQLTVKLEAPLGQIEHIFSHLKWHIQVFVGKVEGTFAETENLRAVTKEELRNYPMPVPHQKIWQKYLEMAHY